MRGRVDVYDVALILVGVAALALRIYDLDGPSVWLDETASWNDARASIVRMLTRVAFPPLYFLLLRAWSALFGGDWWTLRLLSAIAGAAVVVVFGRLVLALFRSRGLMVGAAAALAVMPHQLQYSREVRMYAPWMLAMVVAMLGAVRVVRAEQPRRRDLALWWGGIAAAAATHHYTVLYAVALVPALFVLVGSHWVRKTARDWRRLALLLAPLAAVTVVEIVGAVLFSGFGVDQLVAKVTRDLSARRPARELGVLFTLIVRPNWAAPPPSTTAYVVLVASLIASVALVWSVPRLRRRIAFLLIVAFVPLGIASALSIRAYPRLFSPSVPCLVALLACAVWVAWRRRWSRVLLVPVAAAWMFVMGPRFLDVYRRDIEGWKPVCAAVAASEPDATVLVNEPFMVAPFRVCYRGPLPVRAVPYGGVKIDPQSIGSVAAGKRVVWLIYSHAWRTDRQRRVATMLSVAGFRLDRFQQFPSIDLYRFTRDGTSSPWPDAEPPAHGPDPATP